MVTKILIRSPNWLGDGVMALPAVRALRLRFPSAEIAVMTRSYLRDLWMDSPWVDRVIDVGREKVEELRRAWALRREGFDLYIAFPHSFLSALTGFLSGARVRVGYLSEGRRWLLSEGVKRDGRKIHRVYYYLKLLEPLGGVPPMDLPRIEVRKEHGRWAEGLMEGGIAVGFNPGATYGEAKCWPWEYFVELGRELNKRGARVFIVGGKGDLERNRMIAQEIGQRCVDLTGRTTLGQLAGILRQCRCLVTNDTGPMHVAAAVGTPVIALFGSTDPAVTGPLGEGHRVMRREVPCGPCFKRVCPEGHHKCMREISPTEVLEAVLEILGNG